MGHREWIRKKDAVNLIAEHCYPNEGNPRITKNKARRIIDSAVEAKSIKQIQDWPSWKFDRHDFLQWAAAKWPDLRDQLSIPHIIESGAAPLGITGYEPSANIDSSDPADLLGELNKCREKIKEQSAEIDRLRAIESDLNAHLEKDQSRRKKQGRRGGMDRE